MSANVSDDLTRADIVLLWAMEAFAKAMTPEQVKAWAWELDGKRQIAEEKMLAGRASPAEVSAVALTQSFLSELRTTLAP